MANRFVFLHLCFRAVSVSVSLLPPVQVQAPAQTLRRMLSTVQTRTDTKTDPTTGQKTTTKPKRKTTTVYVLKLEEGKYYVGKSTDIIERFRAHWRGDGAVWTRRYKPIVIEKMVKHASPFDEDKLTKETMAKYGIDNVRGGAYVEMTLSECQKASLRKEIWAANDLCTRCGSPNHFAKDCPGGKT